MSPSLRGRGLKYKVIKMSEYYNKVALFTRAWIEIDILEKALQNYFVALFTRAWIEIDMNYS